MESFIFQTKLKDTSLCDLLIDYFKNDIEHKNRGVTAAGADRGKVSTDVTVSSKNISHFKNKSSQVEYWIALEPESTYSV